MISWLLGKAWPIAGIAFVALGLALGVQTKRLAWAKAEIIEVTKAWALDRAKATEAALKATNENRALEQELQTRADKAASEYNALQLSHARAIVTARADVASLRKSVAAYAAGSGAGAPDTLSASNQRAAALGELLAAAWQADADHAADAESNADAVRTLLEAWPR